MNQLSGTISAIEAQGSVAIVDVSAGVLNLTATLIGSPEQLAGWGCGQMVKMAFKETEVALAKNLQGQISLRNRLPGRITAVEWGQVLTRVRIALDQMGGVEISSVITTRSAKKLSVAVGDVIEGLVKSNEMSILEIATGADEGHSS